MDKPVAKKDLKWLIAFNRSVFALLGIESSFDELPWEQKNTSALMTYMGVVSECRMQLTAQDDEPAALDELTDEMVEKLLRSAQNVIADVWLLSNKLQVVIDEMKRLGLISSGEVKK